MENISYHVATGSIGKELLKEIIAAILTADEGNEELKLKILHAITPKNQDD
jgi:death-on-curing protein